MKTAEEIREQFEAETGRHSTSRSIYIEWLEQKLIQLQPAEGERDMSGFYRWLKENTTFEHMTQVMHSYAEYQNATPSTESSGEKPFGLIPDTFSQMPNTFTGNPSSGEKEEEGECMADFCQCSSPEAYEDCPHRRKPPVPAVDPWEIDSTHQALREWMNEDSLTEQESLALFGLIEKYAKIKYAALRERKEEADRETDYAYAISLLGELIYLKDLKDKDGKTEEYLQRQPEAWQRVRKFLDGEQYAHSSGDRGRKEWPSEEEIELAAKNPENAGSNYVKNHMPGTWHNKVAGFKNGALWAINEMNQGKKSKS